MAPPPAAPHVLYVAWGFPPGRSGGVYRALATANALAAGGFRVTVLTAEREVFERYTGTDPSLEPMVDERIEIRRLPFSWPTMETDKARWGWFRRRVPRVWRKLRVALDRVPFPEVVYGPWARTLRAAALEVHTASPVDCVVATANPHVDFTVASLLHRRGVPFVMDYRDAWMLDVFSGRQVHGDRSRVARIERRLVSRATEIWFVNEPIRRWHAARYPASAERMQVVSNGFDPDFAPEPRLAAVPVGQPVRFGYIGTVSAKVPLAEFAQGWSLARDRSPAMGGATAEIWGYLGFYVEPNPGLLGLVERHRALGLSYAGPLPKGDVRATYETFDALLLLLGSGEYVTSGKVYEYAASALPIVSVHAAANAASDVLRDYPLWFPAAGLDPASVADALHRGAQAAREAGPDVRRQCHDFALPYRRDLQLAPRVAKLHDLCTGRRTD